MDEAASEQFLEKSINRIKEGSKQMGFSESEVMLEGNDLFILMPSSKYNRKYMLKVSIYEGYPINAADYLFVDTETKQEKGIEHWPNDGGQAFKLENPPWICMAGTRAWILHGHPNQGPQTNLIENVVFSIWVKLNKAT